MDELVDALSDNSRMPPPVMFDPGVAVAPGFWERYWSTAYRKWKNKFGAYGGVENPWWDQSTEALVDNSQDIAAIAMGGYSSC